jgi:hypothetical protein
LDKKWKKTLLGFVLIDANCAVFLRLLNALSSLVFKGDIRVAVDALGFDLIGFSEDSSGLVQR